MLWFRWAIYAKGPGVKGAVPNIALWEGGGHLEDRGPPGRSSRHLVHVLEGEGGAPPLPFSFPLLPYEMNKLPLPCAPCHDVLPDHGLTGTGPTGLGLKPLKL